MSEKIEPIDPDGAARADFAVAAANSHGDDEPEREVRFAVVIYGGVSLAIYINGVVQEMLHMVRATAKGAVREELTPVERVYRKLGQIVGAPEDIDEQGIAPRKSAGTGEVQEKPLQDRPGKAGLRPAVREMGRAQAGDVRPAVSPAETTAGTTAGSAGSTGEDAVERDAAKNDPRFRIDEDMPVSARFVVDILSGTSAGGINAIFMAKALANNMSINSLAKMWITQADLDLLLNDEKVKPSNLRQTPAPSLLNSPWMYYQLLTALKSMNETRKDDVQLVEDLDLFCTTTDLRGLPIKIALTDESVKEQRYRNVYHFRRRALNVDNDRRARDAAPVGVPEPASANSSEEPHDFTVDMDPFLAFAARCTSSFPFAFEPMMLADIVNTIKNDDGFRAAYWNSDSTTDKASLFGPEVVKLKGAAKFAEICNVYRVTDRDGHFANRPFGDGGYLNNKPFTYAIETLKKRHATLPVDRKLIYVEPGPESVRDETNDGQAGRPTVIENSLDALVVLPRYETIRQNIESVVEWNSDIGRLHRVIGHIEEELKKQAEKERSDAQEGRNRRAEDKSAAVAESYKETLSYTIYWRLRLSGTADGFACRLADALNVETDSAEGQALRVISGEWRVRMFSGTEEMPDDRDVQQRFLDFFDFDFCERSIRFLRGKLQHLRAGTDEQKQSKRKFLADLARISAEFQAISEERLDLDLTKLKYLEPEESKKPATAQREYLDCWRQYLQFIVDPRRAALVLGVPDECGEQRQDGYKCGVPVAELKTMLSTSDGGRNARVRWLFSGSDAERSETILVATNNQNKLVQMEASARVGFNEIVSKVAEVAIASYAASESRAGVERAPAGEVRVGRVVVSAGSGTNGGPNGGQDGGQDGEDHLPYYDKTRRPPFRNAKVPSRLEKLHTAMEPLFQAIENADARAPQVARGREFFNRQDVQVYPVIFGTTLGEFEQVEMFRISPQDTREIAKTNPPGEQSRPPLRGTSLGNFGAFLDQDWRLSDMLSGRLDGAERLITAVLPDSDEETVRWREHMIKEAQEAIAEEWVGFVGDLNLQRSPEKQAQVDLIMKKSVKLQKGGLLNELRWELAKLIHPEIKEPEPGPADPPPESRWETALKQAMMRLGAKKSNTQPLKSRRGAR